MARDDLARFAKTAAAKKGVGERAIRRAWREIHIAEGSDWNWWYGREGYEAGNPFDRLYKMHLRAVYALLRRPVPDVLKVDGKRGGG
jgi:alpha-amylase/alpha-mannosidase (GH57 family)